MDIYPDSGNYFSHCSIKLDRMSEESFGYIQVYVFVKTFDTPGDCAEHYHSYDGLQANGSDAIPFDRGDEGFLLWHNNGNGTCAICFVQENVFVWMDALTDLGGNTPWDDEGIYQEVMPLVETQSMKISGVLYP